MPLTARLLLLTALLAGVLWALAVGGPRGDVGASALPRDAVPPAQDEPAPATVGLALDEQEDTARRSAPPSRRAPTVSDVPYDPGSVALRMVPLRAGTRLPLLVDGSAATLALADGRRGNWSGQRRGGEDELVFALDPAVPRGVALDLIVQVRRHDEDGTRWRLRRSLTLGPDLELDLGQVPFTRVDPWLYGTVALQPGTAAAGIVVEVMACRGRFRPAESFVTTASATLGRGGAFTFPAPEEPIHAEHLRARVVHADGRTVDHPAPLVQYYPVSVTLQGFRELSLVGRALLAGAPAAGLFTAHAEIEGVAVGTTTVQGDGTFTIAGVPEGTCDVVLLSTRPPGELLRLARVGVFGTPDGAPVALGDVELGGAGDVVELELVDGRGQPAATTLMWRGRRGSGSARLGARAIHRLLLPRGEPVALQVSRTGGLDPLPIVDPSGRLRLVVDP